MVKFVFIAVWCQQLLSRVAVLWLVTYFVFVLGLYDSGTLEKLELSESTLDTYTDPGEMTRRLKIIRAAILEGAK